MKFLQKLAAGTLLLSAIATPALAADIEILVNDTPLTTDVAPSVVNSRVMLPLRSCAEALNATVNFDPATGSITVISDSNKVELALNSTAATINGTLKELDVEPQIVANRTLMPLRFIGEALNAQVAWDSANNSVKITSAKSSQTSQTTQTGQPSTDDTEEVYLPGMDIIANQALQQINSVRMQKGLDALISATELSTMAADHSTAMSTSGKLSNKVTGEEVLSSRANAAGIPQPHELIAGIDYSRENVYQAITALMTNETTRALLLDASAGYIGIAAAKAEDSNLVYLTIEIMPYRAYLIGLPTGSTTTNATLSLRGRSSRLQQEIIVYKISDKNSQMYTDKEIHLATGDGSYFHLELTLEEAGTWAIETSGATVRVTLQS